MFLESRWRHGPAIWIVIKRMMARARLAPGTHLRRLGLLDPHVLTPFGHEQVEAAPAVRTTNDVLHQFVFVSRSRGVPSFVGTLTRPEKCRDAAWASWALKTLGYGRLHRCMGPRARQGVLSPLDQGTPRHHQ